MRSVVLYSKEALPLSLIEIEIREIIRFFLEKPTLFKIGYLDIGWMFQ